MKTKEITLGSQKVTLAYCYATEISYKIMSDEDITDFITEAIGNIQQQKMPELRKSIYLILASLQAFYESKSQKSPVSDKQLMFEATPAELGTAIGTIIGLRSEFYYIPKDEIDESKNTNSDEKNDYPPSTSMNCSWAK